MPPPIPRQDRPGLIRSFPVHPARSKTTAAFPNNGVGRLLHYSFRGLHGVHVSITACRLADRLTRPFHRELRQLCCLRCRPDCYRLERPICRAGLSPAENQRLFTAHPLFQIISSVRRFTGFSIRDCGLWNLPCGGGTLLYILLRVAAGGAYFWPRNSQLFIYDGRSIDSRRRIDGHGGATHRHGR